MTSERGIDSEEQTTSDNPVDTDEIRCICNFSEDDGYTIQCDNCKTWQHMRCMNVDPSVKEYKCHNCSDIKVDKLLKDGKKSRKHQKVRRETESGVYSSPASQMGEPSAIGMSNKSRNRSSDLPPVTKDRHSSSHSRDYQTIEKNIIASKAEELFPKIYSQYQHQHRKRSMSLTSKSDNEHNRDDQESSPIRSISPSLEIGNPFMMDRESLARPLVKTIVKQVNQSRSKMHKKHFNCYGLFAEADISLGRFIVEFKGEVCLKSDYKTNESNQYSLLGVTQPFVLFYPVLNLCVDARRVGTEARFIRRSCHPNAETRTIVVPGDDQQVHLGIFAKHEILKGKEITIGWDWESDHIANSLMQDSIFENEDDDAKRRDEVVKFAAAILRLTECACENKDDCAIYKMQNERKILSKSRKKKLAMDVEDTLIEGEQEASPGVNEDDYEDYVDVPVSTQKKRDNVTRKINRRGKQNVERLNVNDSSLNGNNKNPVEENEASSQIGRKEKKKVKEVDAIIKPDNSQKSKGKESVNRVQEEISGNIKRKSRKTEKSAGNKHTRSSSLSKTDSSKRRPQQQDDEEEEEEDDDDDDDDDDGDDDEQHSDSSLSSLTSSEMSIDDDFPVIEVASDRNNTDTKDPNEQNSKESIEDQLSVLYGPPNKIDHSIETTGTNDILQSSTNPPRPPPPAISGIPFKDYLIQMHEWKRAIETVSASASTENDNNPSPSNAETFGCIESEKSKEPKNNSNDIEMDLTIDKGEKADHGEDLVPLSTPIIPAKRMASSPSLVLHNQNGTNLYSENGSDAKGKRQKTEELQNSIKDKDKEIETEKECTNISQISNMQSLASDNADNADNAESGDLKRQAADFSITNNSANEVSKTAHKKVSLNEYLEKKSTMEDPKSQILSVMENDEKDKTVDNNDISFTKESAASTVNAPIKTKLSLKEFQEIQDKTRAESSTNSVDVLKKSIVSTTEEFKQKSNIVENKQINEQTKSEEILNSAVVNISPKSPKPPKTPNTSNTTTGHNNAASQSSLINDGYFPEVDLPFDFSIDTSKDTDAFNTNEYGRHTNSSHSDGSYEETRGRHSPPYKDYSSIKSSSNYNSSYNLPLGDTSIQTSPRPEHMSPPRGPRYYGGGGHFRGNRMAGSYRGMSMSPGDRGRYHSGSGYFNSAGSLPATPRQGAQSSMMPSSASSPYDPANPDGQGANASNERDSALDNSNIVGNNSGNGITMESKARDYSRPGGDRSDMRDRWSYNNYFNVDRSREREWRERERDDRKDWNNKRMDHYRERDYPYIMATRRPSSNPHQDRYTMIGGVPTGPAAGPNPSQSGISKSNEQSSNNPSQRFGIDDHRRNRR